MAAGFKKASCCCFLQPNRLLIFSFINFCL